MSSYAEFIQKLKKVSDKRNHKVSNSYGVRDGFNYYRKIRPKDSKYVLEDIEYYKIIRTINNKIKDKILEGKDIVLPQRMGKLELRKTQKGVRFSDGKLVNTYPINWDKTLKLWYEDEDAYNRKVLVRDESREVFKLRYDKYNATYNNKAFYQFSTNRDLKIKLKEKIQNNQIDAFLYGKKLY